MDWDKEKAVRELGVPKEFYQELVAGFIGQYEETILDFEKAFREKDFDGMGRAAHFIKGAAGNLRIGEVYLIVRELEASIKGDRDLVMIEKRMENLKNAMEELKKSI